MSSKDMRIVYAHTSSERTSIGNLNDSETRPTPPHAATPQPAATVPKPTSLSTRPGMMAERAVLAPVNRASDKRSMGTEASMAGRYVLQLLVDLR